MVGKLKPDLFFQNFELLALTGGGERSGPHTLALLLLPSEPLGGFSTT